MVAGHKMLRDWLKRTERKGREVADSLGITHGYLSQLLHGVRRPSVDVALRIQETTGISVASWKSDRVSKLEKELEKERQKAVLINE